MKKAIKFLSIGLMAMGLLFTQSCDKCKDVECQHTGTCDKGVCTCPTNATGELCETCNTGYEGDDCATEMRTKFVGTYKYNESASTSCGVTDWPVTISTSSTAIDKIIINGFGAYGCSGVNINVDATVSGSNVTVIAGSFCSGGVEIKSGSGSFSNGVLTVNYTANTGSGDFSCSGTYTKQ